MIAEIDKRAREILERVVDAYIATGEPVGSRTISSAMGMALSPASIRGVMAQLEQNGLLYAPHVSAGRVPTEAGLRLFVDGLIEIGSISETERIAIETRVAGKGATPGQLMEEASTMLAGLAGCAGLVMAPKADRPLRHIEFVLLSPDRVLVVLVHEDGVVENRVIETPVGLPASSLVMAGNFLSARVLGRTLEEARREIAKEISSQRGEIDEITARLVEAGLAITSDADPGQLIVRGHANLLEDVAGDEDLARIRSLFAALETRETLLKLIEETGSAEGVQIFIGAENRLFSMSGCSMVITPYMNSREQMIGAIGVIGPARLNYRRIIPMVDYTAKVIGRLIG